MKDAVSWQSAAFPMPKDNSQVDFGAQCNRSELNHQTSADGSFSEFIYDYQNAY